ncbi:T9SS type A sorting domain-containing protein [Litoribaculum gwangyangense]|uniref:Secretion system C-terminal sorting domain-containing protein n=1 Tax=Litoribaculum gwangyangense TaxID=1130722 RepID=A0ABP9CQB5_9FLAO
MKNNNLTFFLVSFFAVSMMWSQNTSIPDANFENYLETHDANGNTVNIGDSSSMGDGVDGNGLVLTNRINSVLILNVSNLNIDTLSGIQDFDALETLICNNNNLVSLDISNNANLKSLLCSSNQLLSLDVTSNSNLEDLDCSNNQITAINVANNSLLKSLTCSNNRISAIDVSQNTELTSLAISSNRLSVLNVNNNSNLESLFCASNQISNLNLSANTNLKTLDASNNLLTTLDLSTINTVICPDPQTDPVTACQGASSINISNNQLNSLIVANGYNNLLTSFNSQDNPDLFCIQVDSGFTPNSNWMKDDWAYYSDTTCTDIYTYVPDDNFEQALIDLGYDTVLDNLVLTSNINPITTLDISNSNINGLIGIEDFIALQTLNCINNNLDEINLSNNASLVNLNASSNGLTNLDLSNNTNLTILNVSNNTLSGLDLSNNLSINNLNCSNNNIKSLNLSNHPALTNLNCDSNTLEVLNLKNGQNGNLANFSAINNPNLSCIETDTGTVPGGVTWAVDASASYAINCGTYVPDDAFEQALIDLGFDTGTLNSYVPTANIVGVANLNVSGYNITDLTGIEDFLALTTLNCSNNAIIQLDLTENTALTSIICNNNALEFLDIRNGNNINVTTFNATNNSNLFCINVDTAVIGSIPGSWLKDATASYNDDCANNRYTPIPDNNFERALIDLGIDSGALDNQVLTANIEYLTSLNVNSKNIESLEGIKAFVSLTELDCGNNYLDELDVSNMGNLQNLYCGSNYFLTNNPANTNGLLNTSGTVSLTKLFCANNNLTDLNISLNTNLEELDCSNNDITTLDISNNTNLVEVNCNSNPITNLSTATVINTSLLKMSCSSNALNTLLVTNYSALTTLNCRSNTLTQLDITSNSALEVLDFSDNDLADVNLSGKTNLIAVSGSQNQLVEINDLTSPVLESLILDSNQITQLNILNNFPNLKQLSLNNNQLSDLNISTNNNLIELNVSNNQTTALQLPNNLNQLKTFNCSNNLITGDFDLTTLGTGTCPTKNQNNPLDFCPDSITINVSGNQLEFVNIQNGINSEIINFSATNNPNLTCIQVDDINNIGASWLKDATAQYSVDCRFGETYVPDDNFEQALITLGYDAGPLDDYILTATIEVITNLDVSGNNIADLTGIQDFIALQNLDFSSNAVNTVDLSQNINLTQINASNNSLANLDLSSNPNLINLNISNNLFTEFDASVIPTLQVFNGDSNQIIDLDFQLNTALTNVSCLSNVLESLNLKNGQNTSLLNLNVQNNATLTCIETDTGNAPGGVNWLKDATASYSVECHYGETYVPDDAFEQALISLGYDSGTLDDYVLTSNISNITSLNVSNQGIIDLTGIEDFLGLSSLNITGNAITNVDVSANILLTNLDASGNGFTGIDVTSNVNLITLNLSNNSLAQMDLNSNVNLVSLNVSENVLTSLNVDALVSLQTLNCSNNQLDSLQVINNLNLTSLYCQSNLFVSDQLNIQNGNNQNLKIFNATNNPLLSCILVDDPFTVITNANGDFDGWFKDATANYQTVCADADNDGVANADDQCPNTPFGDVVDLFGCSILSLPNNNFTILITSETCLNNNDGKINISTLQYYNYTATLTKDDFNKAYYFTNEIDILNLLAGTYEMCITIEEWPDYISCYDIVISQPEPLSVLTGKINNGKTVSIDMSGSSSYNINFNGLKFNTTNSKITLNLQEGKNSIKVSTDFECQGIYEETILVSDKVFVYPNPFQESINLYLGNMDKENIHVNMYSYLGQLIYSKDIVNHNLDTVDIDTSHLSDGIYTVSVQSKSSVSTFKIVKK